MIPNVKCRTPELIWHVMYDRSGELLDYCLRWQLLPFETTKLSHRTENYWGNSIRPFNWHTEEVLLVIMMESWRSVTTRKCKQGNIICVALHSISLLLSWRESLKIYNLWVNQVSVLYKLLGLNLNIEISMDISFFQIFKTAQKKNLPIQ